MAKNFGGVPGGMTGMMKAINQAMKQAEVAETELANEKIEVTAGGGVIRVVMTGKGDLVELKIAKEVVDPNDVQLLEDLVTTAVRDAITKSTALRNERLQKVIPGGGLGIPGLF